MTGDAASGYTLHLRPCDGTAQGSEGLRRFMEIVNGSRMVFTPEGPSQSSTPTSGTLPSPRLKDKIMPPSRPPPPPPRCATTQNPDKGKTWAAL